MKLIYFPVIIACFASNVFSATLDEETKGINAYYSLYYKQACDLPLKTQTMTSDLASAAQLEIPLGSKDLIGLKVMNKQKSERLFQQLAISEWDQKFIVGISGNAALRIENADVQLEAIKNTQCKEKDFTMYHFNTHEWGSYVLEIQNPEEEFSLVVIPSS